MQRKFHVVTLKTTEWEKKKKEPQSRKLPKKNVLNYISDEIMASLEGIEKSFREMKLFDQKVAITYAYDNFQGLQHEL